MRKDGYTYAVEKNEQGNGYIINIEVGQDIARDSEKLSTVFETCERRIEQLTFEEELNKELNIDKIKGVDFTNIDFKTINTKLDAIKFYSNKFEVDTFKNKMLLNIKAIYDEFSKYGVYKEDK